MIEVHKVQKVQVFFTSPHARVKRSRERCTSCTLCTVIPVGTDAPSRRFVRYVPWAAFEPSRRPGPPTGFSTRVADLPRLLVSTEGSPDA